MPNLDERFTVTIIGPFDLGFRVVDDQGRRGRLNAPDMLPERLRAHIDGVSLVGTELDVTLIWSDDHGYHVSELDAETIRLRRAREEAIRQGWPGIAKGDRMRVVVQHIAGWGLIVACSDGGVAEGSVSAQGLAEPLETFFVGQHLEVEVCEPPEPEHRLRFTQITAPFM